MMRTKSQEVKPVRKLHFSITPIGDAEDLKRWKAEQAAKELKYQVGKAERWAATREAAINSLVSGAWKPFEERYESAATKKLMAAPKEWHPSTFNPVTPQRPSFFARLYYKFTNLFTNLPF